MLLERPSAPGDQPELGALLRSITCTVPEQSAVGLLVMPEANKLVVDGVAWLGNVSTSVAIIFINKVLMARSGYGFVYGMACCRAAARARWQRKAVLSSQGCRHMSGMHVF